MPTPKSSAGAPDPILTAPPPAADDAEAIAQAADDAAEMAEARAAAARELLGLQGASNPPPPAVALAPKPIQPPDKEHPDYLNAMADYRRQQAVWLREQAEWAANGGRGEPPTHLLPRILRVDDTNPRVPGGSEFRLPGQRFTWVPDDPRGGRQVGPATDELVLRMESEGYAAVTWERVKTERPDLAASIETAKLSGPIRSQYGVLMSISHQDAAFREFANAPTGAVRPEDHFYASLQGAAASMNSAAGYEAVRFSRKEDMRSWGEREAA